MSQASSEKRNQRETAITSEEDVPPVIAMRNALPTITSLLVTTCFALILAGSLQATARDGEQPIGFHQDTRPSLHFAVQSPMWDNVSQMSKGQALRQLPVTLAVIVASGLLIAGGGLLGESGNKIQVG